MRWEGRGRARGPVTIQKRRRHDRVIVYPRARCRRPGSASGQGGSGAGVDSIDDWSSMRAESVLRSLSSSCAAALGPPGHMMPCLLASAGPVRLLRLVPHMHACLHEGTRERGREDTCSLAMLFADCWALSLALSPFRQWLMAAPSPLLASHCALRIEWRRVMTSVEASLAGANPQLTSQTSPSGF